MHTAEEMGGGGGEDEPAAASTHSFAALDGEEEFLAHCGAVRKIDSYLSAEF